MNVPAKALWVAAPLREKQTVQSVLSPDGICYRKDIGFFAPVTNELEATVFKMRFCSYWLSGLRRRNSRRMLQPELKNLTSKAVIMRLTWAS
jgi:hypothetical protein